MARRNREVVDRCLSEIISILSHVLQGKKYRVYLFGSRAAGNETETSDLDIAVSAAEDVSNELSLAREMIEESNIPFLVDLVDLRDVPEVLVRRVREEGILIWGT